MQEKEYQYIGWGIFGVTILIAFIWCRNESGLTGLLIRTGQKLFDIRFVQISWLITVLVVCLPGFIAKRYFDNLAWNARLKKAPPPNIHESAKKSKYISLDQAPPPPPKPVEISSLPKHQEEFIATCASCGHFFSAKKTDTDLKCPQCGETIQIGA
ncbi:hypothetical protein L0222_04845 [bacterium]|nr:hypothetical protein [bacterium]MCI0603367.1 hypothetical protein [bacterium]